MKYYKEYQEWLDELQPIHNGLPYSILLERGDPIGFNCGYDDYLNENNLDEDTNFEIRADYLFEKDEKKNRK